MYKWITAVFVENKVKTNDKETRPRLYKLQPTENYANFTFKTPKIVRNVWHSVVEIETKKKLTHTICDYS